MIAVQLLHFPSRLIAGDLAWRSNQPPEHRDIRKLSRKFWKKSKAEEEQKVDGRADRKRELGNAEPLASSCLLMPGAGSQVQTILCRPSSQSERSGQT
jgi:hypothetical protein